MEEIKKEILNINRKVDKMYDALMGSDITKDGGMVKRLYKMEVKQEEMEKEIEQWKKVVGEEIHGLKMRNTRFDTIQKIMWGAVGALAGMIFGYFVLIIFN